MGDSAQERISEYELVEIYTIHSPKRFVHEGHWEVLDGGVGGSLTTHLQEVLPCYKGEQSLTFKRHQRSTVARWEGVHQSTVALKIVLSHVLTAHLLPRCLK